LLPKCPKTFQQQPGRKRIPLLLLQGSSRDHSVIFLKQVHIEYCLAALSHSKQSITEIAFASGFQSISQFNRRFKATMGMSPRQYRDQ